MLVLQGREPRDYIEEVVGVLRQCLPNWIANTVPEPIFECVGDLLLSVSWHPSHQLEAFEVALDGVVSFISR